ncbi:MAG: beta-ketoacyl synthase N-terminal-like domain-containing protein, partial [Thermoguttaceae bacterium]
MKRRVVVTGMGAVTALGRRVEEIWKRVLDGESGVRTLSRFDASAYRVRIGGEILDWSVEGYIEPRDEKKIERFSQFSLVAGIDAVRDAGIDFSRDDPFRSGVMIGSGIGGLGEIEVQHTRL